MDLRALRWSFLAWLCMPLVALAGEAPLRVAALPAAPALAAPTAAPAGAPQAVTTRAWLHAPQAHSTWYALRLVDDWSGATQPLLIVGGNIRARVTVYAPPDYAPRSRMVFDASLDPAYSHRAVVYPLPPDLRAAQPVYVELGQPGQTQPIRFEVSDADGYRAADLWHVRASTFFASVQISMGLVILCFWVVLRDRMYLYFMAYVAAQLVYGAAASGELFAMPGAAWFAPFGYRTGQCAATVSAAFSIGFILEFAELRRWTPRLAAWLGSLRWPFFALAVAVWIRALQPEAWLSNAVNALLVAAALIVLAASWRAWRAGNRQAGFFLLSWVPLLALTMLRVVQLILALPLPAWLEYGFPGSMAWSAVIITVGLADRTLQVRNERDAATRRAEFDPLTGVYNRRAIMERLHAAWRAATFGLEPLAVLFLDIDHFKRINDTRGHAAGDACLLAVTEAIRAELAGHDRVGRYGGEEFLIVLRGDSARTAMAVARRIVARAAALRVPLGGQPVQFTVSVGVAVRDATITGVDALVESADAAQYRAKAEGRNRVVVWRAGGFGAPVASAS